MPGSEPCMPKQQIKSPLHRDPMVVTLNTFLTVNSYSTTVKVTVTLTLESEPAEVFIIWCVHPDHVVASISDEYSSTTVVYGNTCGLHDLISQMV